MNLKISAHLGEIDTPESMDEIDAMLSIGIQRVGHLCFSKPS